VLSSEFYLGNTSLDISPYLQETQMPKVAYRESCDDVK
jgi:hypothetical protein